MASGSLNPVPAADQPTPPTFLGRIRQAMLKDPPASQGANPPRSRSADEIEGEARRADDRERLIGLFGAPLAAVVSFLVIGNQLANDPPAPTRAGQHNKLHVSPAVYHDLLIVLLGLSVVLLVAAMMRRRLYMGIAAALFGLALFNLHYWGFGIPYLLGGSWLIVRSYRLQRELSEAGGGKGRTGSGPGRNQKIRTGQPSANKRYTPRRNGSGR